MLMRAEVGAGRTCRPEVHLEVVAGVKAACSSAEAAEDHLALWVARMISAEAEDAARRPATPGERKRRGDGSGREIDAVCCLVTGSPSPLTVTPPSSHRRVRRRRRPLVATDVGQSAPEGAESPSELLIAAYGPEIHAT